MKASEARAGLRFGPIVIRLERSISPVGPDFELGFPRVGTGNQLLVEFQNQAISVVAIGSDEEECLSLARTRKPTLAWGNLLDETSLVVEGLIFDAEVAFEEQAIQLSDNLLHDLQQRLSLSGRDDPRLHDEFVIPGPSGESRYITAFIAGTQELALVGRNLSLRVDYSDSLRAVQVLARRADLPVVSTQIVRGNFRLSSESTDASDFAMPGPLSPKMFELWNLYNQLEQEAAEARAAEIGQARHGKPEYRQGLVVLPIRATEDLRFLVEVSRERPGLELEVVPAALGFESLSRLERFIGTLEHIDLRARTIALKQDDQRGGSLSNDGLVRPHLAGSIVQAKRRTEVFDRLRAGVYGIEALGYLLREVRPPTTAKRNRRSAVSSAVKKLIPGTLTPAQVRAIDIAINTPDIALIQGPPGTGKSQVIAAIQQRLAELTPDRPSRIILLTSAQHDAVDLVAARTNIFGLPPRRFGQRNLDVESPIATWRRERIAALRNFTESREKSVILRWLSDVLDGYEQTPYSAVASADLIDEVVDRCSTELLPELVERFESRARGLRRQANKSRSAGDIRAVRGLRTTNVGDDDDGSRQIERLLHRRMDSIDNWQSRYVPRLRELLHQTRPRADAVRSLQAELLDELLSNTSFGAVTLADVETRNLMSEAIGQISGARNRPLTPEEAIDLFVLDLEIDEYGVEQAIGEYTAVWASTCQGSASLSLGDLGTKRDLNFPTVIVDEAARANPLDLLIPMVQAGERIILVGDHRQLPQLLDENIARQIRSRGTSDESEPLSKSLFERLFRTFERLEIETGVSRTVSLDVQFRMHPQLGEFVSRVFYEPYGEGFTSGRSETDFVHGISRFEGQVASWVDVPIEAGMVERQGKSLTRPAEAREVASIVAGILQEAPNLSIGVISFYAAQVELIHEELQHHGVTEVTVDGVAIAEKYRVLVSESGKREERLRIGTVDSFQGKEFDVVVLSVVRTGGVPAGASVSDAFGFLASENRLCVALSRQKRLLVVVGDRSILQLRQATLVRGIPELGELCGTIS